MDIALIIALVAAVSSTLVAFVALITDRLQWGILKYIKSEFELRAKQWEENGSVGDQIGNWLTFTEKEGEPTNLEVLAQTAGRAMFSSASASMKAGMSGDVRHQNGIDKQLFAAMQNSNPEMKAISVFLDKLGLGDLASPEEMPYVINWLQKNQLLGKAQNNGYQLSSREGLM